MRDDAVTTLDEEAVLERATAAAHSIVRRAGIATRAEWNLTGSS